MVVGATKGIVVCGLVGGHCNGEEASIVAGHGVGSSGRGGGVDDGGEQHGRWCFKIHHCMWVGWRVLRWFGGWDCCWAVTTSIIASLHHHHSLPPSFSSFLLL